MDNARNFTTLNIDDILPNRFQPRIHFDEVKLNELAESIMKYGVIQPIIVRQIANKFEIIAGERRYKASKIAGKSTIPAIIISLNDKESEEIALLENVQRQNLTPIEEAVSYKRILDMGYITQDGLAKKLGKTQSTIANKVRLLNLDDQVQYALLNGKISERHARSLLRLHNRGQQVEMLNKIINERLTVKKTDEEIKKILTNKTEIEETSEGNNQKVTTTEPVEELFTEPVVKKTRRAVAVASHEIIRVKPPKELEEKIDRKGVVNMDINKIMNEAKDINVPEQTKDIANLMKHDNVISSDSTPISINQNSDLENSQFNDSVMAPDQVEPFNDIHLANDGKNKFINIANLVPEEPQPMKVEPTPVSTVSFDSIFNQTPADLQTTNASQPALNTSGTEKHPVESGVQTKTDTSLFEHSQRPIIPEPINETPQPILMEENNNSNSGIGIADAVKKAMNTEPPMSNAIRVPDIQSVDETKNIDTVKSDVINSMNEPIKSNGENNHQLYDELKVQQPNTFVQQPSISNIPNSEILESTTMSSTISEPVASVPNPTANFIAAIKLIRNCAAEIEKLGYTLDVDEIDLGNSYQATFKISE